MTECPATSLIGDRVSRMAATEAAETLRELFGRKSAATVLKRGSALVAFIAWCRKTFRDEEPMPFRTLHMEGYLAPEPAPCLPQFISSTVQRSSSCEAEWYAAVTAACDALYLRQTLCFLLGETPQCTIRIDNQAARQLAHHQGPSAKTRHVDARLFWVQEKVKDRVLAFGPVSGVVNPSDVGTKVLAEKRFRAMLGAQQYVDTECRDLDVGCEEWNDLLSEVATSVQLRRIRSRFASLRGTARRRMEMIMMIECAPVHCA